ncbi:type II CRISPR RNA-guided endonuclease Cas9 [Hwanghaeella sp.]|uniref:type II CRISPR RNA-guided endonuclease Cas9 n=1 Tax=Hwanghaeella sp. TaxID=2605943 RepID=UPI003CCBFDCD
MNTWRLGIDLGTNSIGVAALTLDREKRVSGLLDLGVRIFSDGRNPKDKQSLAAKRRVPRGMRRTRDRAKNRNARYLRELQEFGLMPIQSCPPTKEEQALRATLEAKDPYILRTKALDERLEPFEIGRALFHLKRRGFKSNRKTDGGDEDNGKIRDAARRTRELLEEAGARTLGEWLGRSRLEVVAENECRRKGERVPSPQVRTRLRGTGAKAHYYFYPTRDMILDEFDLLWKAQKEWHEELLTDDAYNTLRETLSWQWPLKAQPVGKCRLEPTKERAPRALPSVQHLRIFQDLNHLEIQMPGAPWRKITKEERDVLAAKALKQSKCEFEKMRSWLKLPKNARFNFESERRKHLDGDLTAAKIRSNKFWGKGWDDLSLDVQNAVVHRLLNQEDEAVLIRWLRQEHGLSEETATAVSRASLPSGHGAFCIEVSERLLKELTADVVAYDEAVRRAGYDSHSAFENETSPSGRLPYYGKVLERHVAFGSGDPGDSDEKRYGKIANPTVHVALNQLRHVVNDLIGRFGRPTQIVVEVARQLPLSGQGQRDLERQQKDNQKTNDQRREILAKQGIADSYANRLRLRLWEELNRDDPLDRRCVFTGEQISIARLFSDEVEIEHLLPFSRTLDDSPANKTVSMRSANRIKGRQSPYEAFAHSPQGFDWAAILARSENLPGNKRWRFSPDAMERYENGDRDFLARQLVDTQYIARVAKDYLDVTGADVWVTPGKLTSDLRWALGLDSVLPGHNAEETGNVSKNRLDHRHHAVDALVVALTDRRLLQQAATLSGRREAENHFRLLPNLGDPWPGFRDDVRSCVDNIVVSHKPDHGVQGALHNDTAYGLLDPKAEPNGVRDVVHRVPLDSFKKRKDLERIRDDVLRDYFLRNTHSVADKDLGNVLVELGESLRPPVRRVRIVERLNVIPIRDDAGEAYKAYKGDANYCYDIFTDQKGRWTGRVISRFEANQEGFNPANRYSTDGEPLVMRLRVNDMLELENDGARQIMRIVKLASGKITLAAHHEAGSLKARDADKNDPFKYLTLSPSSLQLRNGRTVHSSPSGVIRHKGNLS